MTDTVNMHIHLIREQLLLKGWKGNNSNQNMRNASNSIEFEKLESDNGQIFDINLYTIDERSHKKFIGAIFAYNREGSHHPLDTIIQNVTSSFPN